MTQIISGDVDPETLASLVQAAGMIYESSLELASVAPGAPGIHADPLSCGQAPPDVVLVDDVQWKETTIRDFVGSVRASAESRNAPIVLSIRRDALGASTRAFTDLFDTALSLRPAARPETVARHVQRSSNFVPRSRYGGSYALPGSLSGHGIIPRPVGAFPPSRQPPPAKRN